jgi:hypothetical protein
MYRKAIDEIAAPRTYGSKPRVRSLKVIEYLLDGAGSGIDNVRTNSCPSCREEVDLNPC